MRSRRLLTIGVPCLIASVGLCLATWLGARPYRSPEAELPSPLPPSISTSVPPAVGAEPAQRDSQHEPLAKAEPKKNQRTRVGSARLNQLEVVLLLGIDDGPGKRGAGLADTIVAVLLDDQHGRAGLVSIPRDLYVDIPGHPPDRINTVYAIARRTRVAPLPLLQRVLLDTLGLPVKHMLAIDLGVFESGVDALGGVEVDVPCPVIDDFRDSRTESGRRVLDARAGRVLMDGATAAMYVRSRHGRSDFSRARRQQSVLMGIRERLTGIEGITRVPELWNLFESSVKSDMSRLELLDLARRLLGTPAGALHGVVLGPEHTTGWRAPDGRSVLLPNAEKIQQALTTVFDAPSPGIASRPETCPPATVALKSTHPLRLAESSRTAEPQRDDRGGAPRGLASEHSSSSQGYGVAIGSTGEPQSPAPRAGSAPRGS